MNIALITSNNLRHINFAKIICEHINVKHIVFEHKAYGSESLQDKELSYFPDCVEWEPDVKHTFQYHGNVSKLLVESLLKELELDYIFTFGCGLLKPSIYNIPKYGCINIHTGLVQYYRGVDSNIWAIMDEHMDRIGSTIHYIDSSIDAGKVIDQRKLDLTTLSSSDTLDDLFIKTCILGIDLLVDNLESILENKINTIDCKTSGKLYQNKDRNEEIVFKAEQKLKELLS
ncbi:hypothetical protein CMI47_12135 [Candidatus Pacearchaeota archaeon]|nr:hypothetical protein [Candidatus Pacearchaeota archaeon]|tara:strand:+ start:2336 stop:3025 length:690 start_codon:yes stop_codon:yes gene_type:complete